MKYFYFENKNRLSSKVCNLLLKRLISRFSIKLNFNPYQWSGFSDWGTKLVMGAAVGNLGVYAWERLRWTKFRQEQAFRTRFLQNFIYFFLSFYSLLYIRGGLLSGYQIQQKLKIPGNRILGKNLEIRNSETIPNLEIFVKIL